MSEATPPTHAAAADATAENWSDTLRIQLAERLGMAAAELDPQVNLLQLGLDSIDVIGWQHRFRARGLRVSLHELYRRPSLQGWLAVLRQAERSRPSKVESLPAGATMQVGESFPLTPVQHAYLVGRSPQQTLGGVGCHLYQEFDGVGLDPDRLESAVRRLVHRHPMLAVAFRSDGSQVRLPEPTWKGVVRHDLRVLDKSACQAALLELRERLSHQLLDVEAGRCISFDLALLPDGRHRLLTGIDLLVADAASYTQLFDELAGMVAGRELPPLDPDYDFCSYLQHRQRISEVDREDARHYWLARLDSLPPSPGLPLACDPAQLVCVRIRRRARRLDPVQWENFKRHAGEAGLTPTMALATCFGAVLSRWSGQSRLLINLTLFDRQPLHPAVAQMVADFTNVLLLDMQCEGENFATLASENQQVFAAAYEHHDYSGVEVMRELKKRGRHPHGAPIVFTSTLGRPLLGDSLGDALGEPGWGVSQTPQVWIDHMALEQGGSALLQWDCNEALFPAGLLDTLFAHYLAWVERLCADPEAWRRPLPDALPVSHQRARRRANATAAPLPDATLHEAFFAAANTHGEKMAIALGDVQFGHAELAARARGLSLRVREAGVAAGARVGICMPKSIGQAVAALAVLHAGATYVPIAPDQPPARIAQICAGADLSLLLVCAEDVQSESYAPELLRIAWQQALPMAVLPPVPVAPDQAAYIIYTSGSTGQPKGVVVSHRAALNTCQDVNRRYGVGTGDRVLALSALHFDLSVYDLFGVLGAGGGVVLVEESQRRDPATWCELIARYDVTLWNTVPALFDMLLTYAEAFELDAPSRLRLVLLSGDWVGLDLPARYRAYAPSGRFIALGGATEAAIWSNAYEVSEVPAHWRSIPYGMPLANQRYRVVDALGRDCPDWVEGELWIGGAGVALGYFNDPERTRAQFVDTAEVRWYRTGDIGRYWPDGTLEFLGRRDKQIKIGGYRIELGEIDAALARVEGVKTGLALAAGEREKQLVAYVVPQGEALSRLIEADPRLPADYADWLPPVDMTEDGSAAEHESAVVGNFLCQHLRLQGLDFTEGLSAVEAARNYGCIPMFLPLFTDWLRLLVQQGHLTTNGGRYRWGQVRPDRELSAGHELSPLAEALISHHHTLSQVACGLRPPTTLLEHPQWSPEQVVLRLAGSERSMAALAQIIEALAGRLHRPVRLVELGARSGLAAMWLLQRLDATVLDYRGLDESAEMVLRTRERLVSHPNADVRRWAPGVVADLRHSADVIWFNNSLHRQRDVPAALADAMALAAAGGLVLLAEIPALPPQGLVSVELFAEAVERPQDQLKDEQAWRRVLTAQGLTIEAARHDGQLLVFALRAPSCVRMPDTDALRCELARQLPSYMVPARLHLLDALPLTANGKIDHRALLALATAGSVPDATEESPRTPQEQALASLWQRMLNRPRLHRHSDFFQLGGDSLLATRLIGELERAGYAAMLGDLFAYPQLATFAATLQTAISKSPVVAAIDQDRRYEPFPLTDLQQAYLVGRQRGFALGGIGSHFFVKFAVEDLDLTRFDAAWKRLIDRHDMLRAVVRDGRQQVLPEVPTFTPERHRFADLAGEEAQALHEELAHTVYDPTRWPVFGVHVAQDSGRTSLVYVSLDNLLLDGMSMQILFAELKRLYLDPAASLPPIGIGFRDYMMRAPAPAACAEALAYWRARLPSLPPAPRLPLRCDPADVERPRFVRLKASLPSESWRALRAAAAEHQLTPSSLLLAAYATVLSSWSTQPGLCINLTLFDRRPVHSDIDRVLGDFTSLLLLAWQPRASWLDSALAMQRRLRADMAHREVSAIRVMREMAAREGVAATSMPVVFTSALGYDPQQGFLDHHSWLRPIDGLSQTPQTWLDHQVYESADALHYNWDAVEQLFEPTLLQAMFADYIRLLERLAQDATVWQIPWDQLTPRRTVGTALPAAVRETARPPAAPVSPKNTDVEPLVEHLRQHFTVLTGRAIAARQNFFDAGATSLQLVRLHAKLHHEGYADLEVTELFSHPNPYALAGRLAGLHPVTKTESSDRQTRLDSRQARRVRRIELRP